MKVDAPVCDGRLRLVGRKNTVVDVSLHDFCQGLAFDERAEGSPDPHSHGPERGSNTGAHGNMVADVKSKGFSLPADARR